MNDLEIGYLAGIIDGEGCISLIVNKDKIEGQTIQVSSTDYDILERIQAYSGGLGRIVGPYKRNARSNIACKTPKPQYTWKLSDRAGCEEVLRAIYPHMSVRRKTAIDRVLNHIESRKIINCKYCGNVFEPAPKRKYCSTDCATASQADMAKKRMKAK